jgi:hypothetical protein
MPMSSPEPKNPISRIAANLISSEKGGFALTEEACDLVVADGRFNAWIASKKNRSEAHPLSEEDWSQLFEACDGIYADALRAWEQYGSYDWPRGRFDEWAQVSEQLRRSLREARLRLDDLGRAQGRGNQRGREPVDA